MPDVSCLRMVRVHCQKGGANCGKGFAIEVSHTHAFGSYDWPVPSSDHLQGSTGLAQAAQVLKLELEFKNPVTDGCGVCLCRI